MHFVAHLNLRCCCAERRFANAVCVWEQRKIIELFLPFTRFFYIFAKKEPAVPTPCTAKERVCAGILQSAKRAILMQTVCYLSTLIHEQAGRYGEKTALTYQPFGETTWKTVSWNEFSNKVKTVSNALLNLGLKPQEHIAVFSQNCKEYLYTDFGAYGIKGVSIPFYATCSEQQIQYMMNDAGVRFLFVGEQEQYDKAYRAFPLCPTLERIIVFDNHVRIHSHDVNAIYFSDFLKLGDGWPRQSEVEALSAGVTDEELCNILYTSGTTGDSKGVMLSFGQYFAALKANAASVAVTHRDRVINFLPFTHIFERGWAYLSLSVGAELIINTNPKDILESMRGTNPTSMAAVPRFWEKVYQAVMDKVERSSALQQRIFRHALAVGRKYHIEYLSRGKRPPLALALEYSLIDKTLLSKVRKQIGLLNPNIFPTAGATVSEEIEEFVHAVGIDMIVGYGLTESLATVSCDRKGKPYTIGSVGTPIPGIEVKIGENNEVLLKGPTITRGYYKRDSVNATAFDADGFFHTGDAGYMRNGELFLTERIKDLFKTSNGKYIAPQAIEAIFLVDKFIDQIAVVADNRKFVSALVVPNYELLEEYARNNGIDFADRTALCADERIYTMVMERLNTLQQQLASYEKVKRIVLLDHHFSVENGELTNTLKLRRGVAYKRYKDRIEDIYRE